MALFTAERNFRLDDGVTFGNTSPGTKGVDWPGETDDVDVAGFALTQGTATGVGSLTDLVTTGGTLTLTGSFTCPDVQNVSIIVAGGVTATISFGTSGVDPGCQRSVGNDAIMVYGTLTDVTGVLINRAGGGSGVHYEGVGVIDFSGDLVNSGSGIGAELVNGIWTDFSGTLTNSGSGKGFSVASMKVLDNFSGILNNTGTGYGLYIVSSGSKLTNFSGQCYDSGRGKALYSKGWIENFTGTVGRPSSQPDCVAGNIVQGKTILGVTGTRPPGYGIGGAPILGGW